MANDQDEKKLEDQAIEQEPDKGTGDEDVDVNDLTLEDIEKMEKADEGEGDESEPEEAEPEGAEPEDKDKKDGRSDFDKEVDAETDVVKLRERLKGLQGLATKSKQETAELRRELQETKSKLKTQVESDFEELDDEQLESLRETDPDAYIEYQESKKEHEQKVKDSETQLLEDTMRLQASEASDFIAERFKVKFDMSIPPDKQPDEIKKIIAKDGPLMQIDEYLKTNVIPKDGVYTAKQMNDAYKVLFHDQLMSDARKGIREQTLNDIEKASITGSVMDKSSSGGGGRTKPINVDELTQEQINNMSEAELDRALADA